jgi:TldD protein
VKELAQLALDTAKSKGADYVDVRLNRYRRQEIHCENERVARLADSEDIGLGVRVLASGAWGFAGTSGLTREEVMRAATEAVTIAKASATALRKPVTLLPEPPRVVQFMTPYSIDPLAVPVAEKIGLLLEINERLLKHSGIKRADAYMILRKEERQYLNSDGSDMSSQVVTTAHAYQATAVGGGDARQRSYTPPPLTIGYEHVDRGKLLAEADRVAEEAIEHLHAPESPEGEFDLILDPHHLALTIHESVGHATELDRALGYEESLAGRTFATPEKLNNLQYASGIVSFVADNTLLHGLATNGFDDDGVPNQKWFIVEDGMFRGYSTSREVAGEIGLERSVGGCRADHWGSIPIVRIPNLGLAPGKKPLTPDELIADTKDGIYIEGRGSFSIDQMRCNFQFGGDSFWRIKDGKKVGMLKNVTYQSNTVDFWNSCDAICDERFWLQDGILNCGKGDPMQSNQMSHGAAPARFRKVRVRPAR